jgi:DNA replication and repair protein RecF
MLSAGQQKKLLMLMIIANAKLLNARINTPVIILLDEAASHLDADSRADLFSRLDLTPAQVWITGADTDTFKNIKNALFVSCTNGDACCKLGT